MRSSFLGCGFAVVALLAGPVAASASAINVNNFLTNPSFENTGTALTDWNTNPNNGSVQLCAGGTGCGARTAASGNEFVEFYKDAGSPAASSENLYQASSLSLPTSGGGSQEYDLTFYLRTVDTLSSGQLTVSWLRGPFPGGQTDNICGFAGASLAGGTINRNIPTGSGSACLFTLSTTDLNTLVGSAWTQFTLVLTFPGQTFGAGGSQQTLGVQFHTDNFQNGNQRLDLDLQSDTSIDLRGAAVPEPATLGLLGLGLLGMGARLRARKR